MITIVVNDELDETIENKRNILWNIEKSLEPLEDEINQLKKQRLMNILKNKTYKTFPLNEEYEGKELQNIIFLTEDGKEELYYGDEILKVKNGYPYYSSYEGGILEFDDKDGKFHYWYHYREDVKNYVGYTVIEIGD